MWEDPACQGRCQRVGVGFLQHLGLHLDLKVCRRGGETCEGIIHRRKTGTNVCVLVRFPCLVCLSHSPATWSCSSGTDNLESGGWPHTYCIISSQTQIGHLFLRPPRLSRAVLFFPRSRAIQFHRTAFLPLIIFLPFCLKMKNILHFHTEFKAFQIGLYQTPVDIYCQAKRVKNEQQTGIGPNFFDLF